MVCGDKRPKDDDDDDEEEEDDDDDDDDEVADKGGTESSRPGNSTQSTTPKHSISNKCLSR